MSNIFGLIIWILFVSHFSTADSLQNNSQNNKNESSIEDSNSTLNVLVRVAALEAHNNLRLRHDVPLLEWDHDLAKLAQSVANHLVATHSLSSTTDVENVGENIAGFMGVGGLNETKRSIHNGIMDWYSQIKDYNWKEPEKNWFQGVSQFSQIVWKSTKFLGFAYAVNEKQGFGVVVAEYKPRGNILGFYDDNVKQQRDDSTRKSKEL